MHLERPSCRIAAEQRDGRAPGHCPLLPCFRPKGYHNSATSKTAALHDFNRCYDRFGVKTGKAQHEQTSASPPSACLIDVDVGVDPQALAIELRGISERVLDAVGARLALPTGVVVSQS